MEEGSVENKGDDLVDLPPGFRFHPTDEEIITHYLTEKVMNSSFSAKAIGEVDLNKCEPWDLPKKAKRGEKEWYFFCQRDRKYPTGMRTNRATESGYWKATGKDKEIYKGKGCLVGMKKTLVFYRGRAPKGEKTNWIMHEYRVEGGFSYYNLTKAKDEWVVSRVFHKSTGIKKSPISSLPRMNSFWGDHHQSLDRPSPPLLVDPPNYSNISRPAEDDFMGMTAASSSARSSSDGDYLSYFPASISDRPLQKQQDHNDFLLPSNKYYTSTNPFFYPQIPPPNPLFHFKASPYPCYLHEERSYSIPSFPGPGGIDQGMSRAGAANHEISGLEGQCKVEQFSSNQSMVSLAQDTGLSTDVNTEISSVVSKHDIGNDRSYKDLEDPSLGPIADLECLWNY